MYPTSSFSGIITKEVISNSVLKKGKSAAIPLFNASEVLSSASNKAKLFKKIFFKNSNLDDLDISLPASPF